METVGLIEYYKTVGRGIIRTPNGARVVPLCIQTDHAAQQRCKCRRVQSSLVALKCQFVCFAKDREVSPFNYDNLLNMDEVT